MDSEQKNTFPRNLHNDEDEVDTLMKHLDVEPELVQELYELRSSTAPDCPPPISQYLPPIQQDQPDVAADTTDPGVPQSYGQQPGNSAAPVTHKEVNTQVGYQQQAATYYEMGFGGNMESDGLHIMESITKLSGDEQQQTMVGFQQCQNPELQQQQTNLSFQGGQQAQLSSQGQPQAQRNFQMQQQVQLSSQGGQYAHLSSQWLQQPQLSSQMQPWIQISPEMQQHLQMVGELPPTPPYEQNNQQAGYPNPSMQQPHSIMQPPLQDLSTHTLYQVQAEHTYAPVPSAPVKRGKAKKNSKDNKKELSQKTSYNMAWTLKKFLTFMRLNNYGDAPFTMSKQQLAHILPRFFRRLRKVNGGMYGVHSLLNIRAMLSSYLKIRHYLKDDIDIVSGREFRRANEVFEAQVRMARMTNIPVTNQPITDKHLNQIIREQFSTLNKKTLITKVWFDMTRYFGNQVAIPQSQWTRDMINVYFDASCDLFYVTWCTSYANGQEHRMYETKVDGCPVSSLTYLLTKSSAANNQLFQVRAHGSDGSIWYGPQGLDEEDFENMMMDMSVTGNLPVRYTNISVKRTSYNSLYQPRVPLYGDGSTFCGEYTFDDVYNCRARDPATKVVPNH